MNSRAHTESVSLSRQQAAERHNRVLLHALQTAHPVIVDGKEHFIHTLTYQLYGGGISTSVHLAGADEPVQPDRVTVTAAAPD